MKKDLMKPREEKKDETMLKNLHLMVLKTQRQMQMQRKRFVTVAMHKKLESDVKQLSSKVDEMSSKIDEMYQLLRSQSRVSTTGKFPSHKYYSEYFHISA